MITLHIKTQAENNLVVMGDIIKIKNKAAFQQDDGTQAFICDA